MKSIAMRAFFLIGLTAALISCGKSQEQIVQEHLAKRKAPGFVRLINLSSKPLNFKVVAPSASAAVLEGDASDFYTILAGTSKVEIADADGNGIATIDVPVAPKEGVSVLATDSNPKGQVVPSELNRYDSPDASIRVIGASGMNGIVAVVKGPAGTTFTDKLDSPPAPHSCPPGDYKVEIKNAEGKTVAKVGLSALAKKAYTVAASNQSSGKVVARSFLNNPDRRPVGSGASAN